MCKANVLAGVRGIWQRQQNKKLYLVKDTYIHAFPMSGEFNLKTSEMLFLYIQTTCCRIVGEYVFAKF